MARDNINLMPRNSGFTLIELIITITIVAVLSSFVLMTWPGQQKKARDSKKKTEIKQYQIALENYANKNNGLYPAQTPAADINSKCSLLNVPTAACPNPTGFSYLTSGTISYALWFQLESTLKYFLVCSNGITTETSSTPSMANCP